GFAMGWSWSLFICNAITEDVTRIGIGHVLSIPADAAGIVSERAPCARLGRGELAGASCVDNANVVDSPRELVDAALRAILREFERRGLSFHEVCYATLDFVCCGVRSDFILGRAAPQRDRAWRLRRAVAALIDRRGCAATAMEVILGHVVHHFMLMRPALAILSPLYRVAYSDCDYCKFDVEQLRELGLVKALIPLAGVDLGAPWHPWAYCSDASVWGYALATSKFEPDELRDIGAYRDRWRFLALDRYSDDPGGLTGAECSTLASYAAGASDDAAFAGLDPPPPGRSGPRRRRAARIDVEAPSAAACRGGIPALPDSALAAHRWQLVVRGAFLFGAPIHVLEGRATLLGLRRATRSVAAHGCRALSIGDNLSSMMAFEKGRCANPVLRQLACQAAARQLATGIQHYHRCSESKRDPTDYDSRAADRFGSRPARRSGARLATSASPLACRPRRRRWAPPAWRPRTRARCILELYAGCARLTAACLDEGLQAWVPVDISRGSWHDLTDKNVIGVIRSLIVRRDAWHVHLGTPCTPFSLATPARSRAKHLASGSSSVAFALDILRLRVRFGVTWSVENPSASRLWKCPEVIAFLERHRHYFVHMHYCHYNCRYLEPTTIVTDLKPLRALEASCSRDHFHEVLEGLVRLGPGKGTAWKTSLAGRYPERLPAASARRALAAAPISRPRARRPRTAIGEQRAGHSDVARVDFLARRRVKPLTQQHYVKAAAEVRRFAALHHYLGQTAAQRDKLMVDYLQHVFLAGDGIFAARAALYGYAFEGRLNLKEASEFPQAAVLIIEPCLSSPALQQRLLGAAVAVAFDGYLRLSELLSIKSCDVTCLQHSATSGYPQVSITLMPSSPPDAPPSTTAKSGECDDAVTFGGGGPGTTPRRWAARLLRDLKLATPSTRPLFPFGVREFQLAFRQAADAAGLQRLRLCPHALRHGGASSDFALKARALAEAQRRGRWKCAASVRRHEKAGRLTRQLAKLS
ncbi:unnamed protein product, partial [Prorocentrum cordatum]